MPHYLMLTKLTESGRKTIREHPERIQEVNQEVERMVQGVRVLNQWFLMGPYDFATIIQAHPSPFLDKTYIAIIPLLNLVEEGRGICPII